MCGQLRSKVSGIKNVQDCYCKISFLKYWLCFKKRHCFLTVKSNAKISVSRNQCLILFFSVKVNQQILFNARRDKKRNTNICFIFNISFDWSKYILHFEFFYLLVKPVGSKTVFLKRLFQKLLLYEILSFLIGV